MTAHAAPAPAGLCGATARGAVAFAAGLIFGVGLLVSGMTQPAKVVGFLDVAHGWDPSLAFVMLGAVGVHALLLRTILRRQGPLCGTRFHLPARRGADARLVAGALIFGAGWGLGGMCPGPAVVAAASLAPQVLVFGVAMAAGMAIFEVVERTRHKSSRRSARA